MERARNAKSINERPWYKLLNDSENELALFSSPHSDLPSVLVINTNKSGF
jgi:hypothetical protein